MIAIAIFLALIFLTLGAILSLTIFQSRRTHRMTDKLDVLQQLALDSQAQLAEAETKEAIFRTQQAATNAAMLAAIARVEAVINALQGQNDPRLDAAINSLSTLKTGLIGINDALASATVAEKAEQDTLDAERPDPPPPAGPTPIA